MKKENLRAAAFISLLILIVAEIVCSFGNTAFAATMPAFEPLPSIDAQVNMPTAVTVDSHGRIYVVEAEENEVRVFSQSGQYLATIAGLNRPISVAVNETGMIYVGSASLGNVTVFAADFTEQFKLGIGDGEFSEPVDLDIDSSGQIYVVDRGSNMIRVYTAAGVLLKSIGTVGNGNGQLYHPTSLAIDPVSHEMVIMDHQQILDEFTGSWIDGARIQFFAMDGTFRRGYPKFGYSTKTGQLLQPNQVAVDRESRIYVSDSRCQKIMVYGNSGGFLGMIDDIKHPLLMPLGLTTSTSGRLYVASLRGGKVHTFGIEAYSSMDLAPVTLNFTAPEGSTPPAPQTITINNSGKQVLIWTAATTTTWLNLESAAGTLQPAAMRALAAGVKNTGLTEGTYQGSISVNALGIEEKVAVTLTVTNPLLVSPASLSLTTIMGTNPSPLSLSVAHAGTDPLNWTATADQSWLKLSKGTGTTPDQVEINTDISDLTPGTHTASITFTNDSTDSTVLVPVTLTVKPNPLLVNPARLSFTTTTGADSLSSQSLSIDTIAESGPLNWTAIADQSWLKLSASAGTTPDQVKIDTDTSVLASGTHTGTIAFTNDSTGSTVLIPVTLTVKPNPLLVSPTRLSFTTTTGTDSLTSQSLSVGTNTETGSLNWNAMADQFWLKLSKSTGTTPDQVETNADVSDLASGTHTATITFINSSTGSTVLVPVTLTVKSTSLLVSPASLSFTSKGNKGKGNNTSPSSQSLSIKTNAETDPLWSATADQSWLKLSKAKGTTPDQVEIDTDVSDFVPGTYTANITFNNDSTSGSILVPVSLSIGEAGMFPWPTIIQNIAIIGEQQLKQDKNDMGQTNKIQQPTKISGPKIR